MDFSLSLKQHYDDLTYSERDVVSYLYNNISESHKMGIMDVAAATLVSKSTVFRLSQKLGYSGFSEMKKSLQTLDVQQQNTSRHANWIEELRDEEDNFLRYLETVNFDVLTTIVNQSRKIYLYATGTTQQSYLQIFYSQLLLLNLPVNLIFGQSSLEAVLPVIHSNDVIIVVSYGGETDHIKKPLRLIAASGAVIISITSFGKNFLVKHAQYSLFYEGTTLNNYDVSMIQLAQILDFFVRKLQVN